MSLRPVEATENQFLKTKQPQSHRTVQVHCIAHGSCRRNIYKPRKGSHQRFPPPSSAKPFPAVVMSRPSPLWLIFWLPFFLALEPFMASVAFRTNLIFQQAPKALSYLTLPSSQSVFLHSFLVGTTLCMLKSRHSILSQGLPQWSGPPA